MHNKKKFITRVICRVNCIHSLLASLVCNNHATTATIAVAKQLSYISVPRPFLDKQMAGQTD